MGKNIVGIFENSYKQIIDTLNNVEEIKKYIYLEVGQTIPIKMGVI